jgi:hypothetical protein
VCNESGHDSSALCPYDDLVMYFSKRIRAILWMSQLMVLCAGAQQYSFHEDGENEGLSSLTVNCFLQDHSGFVWVCTENGLYEFDGATFTRIGAAQGLPDSYIVSIHEDAEGELWVGTSNHLYHGDGKRFSVIPSAAYGLTGSSGQQLGSTVSGQALAVSHHRLFQLTWRWPGCLRGWESRLRLPARRMRNNWPIWPQPQS